MEHCGSEKYPVIRLEGRGEVIQGDIVFLSYDSLAVRLKTPARGGCVRMKAYPPYGNGYLVDEDGYINQRGQQTAAEMLLDLHRAARHLNTIRDELVTVITEGRSPAQKLWTHRPAAAHPEFHQLRKGGIRRSQVLRTQPVVGDTPIS